MILDAETHPGLAMAIAGFLAEHAAALPAHTLAAVLQAQGHLSPYDRYVKTLEALFAAGDDAGVAGLEVCRALAAFAATWFAPIPGPDDIGAPARAAGIAKACRRRLGELTELEAPAVDDPAPLAAYLPAE